MAKAAKGMALAAVVSPPKAVRLRHIRQLMSLGKWETGKTAYELAETWGLAESTVRGDAAEASFSLREAIADVEGLRVEILMALGAAKRRADEEENHGRAAMALIRALELQAKLTGCMAPVKHAVSVNDPAGEVLPGWTLDPCEDDEGNAHESN